MDGDLENLLSFAEDAQDWRRSDALLRLSGLDANARKSIGIGRFFGVFSTNGGGALIRFLNSVVLRGHSTASARISMMRESSQNPVLTLINATSNIPTLLADQSNGPSAHARNSSVLISTQLPSLDSSSTTVWRDSSQLAAIP